MIPQAGSAYAYTYATLGELVAWIIGWDLILEYAVGNVAVAISWGDYFTTLLRGVGIDLPVWLTTGYRTALLSPNPDMRALLDTAPRLAGVPLLVNLPAFAIVMVITWLLLRGARESSTANNVMVVIKLAALALFIGVGVMNIDTPNWTPFAPNGFTGIHLGTLFAFALVCAGVLVLRIKEPDRPRPFRVPFIWMVAPLGAAACGFVMIGLPYQAWERFALWLGAGLIVYFGYGIRHSRLRR